MDDCSEKRGAVCRGCGHPAPWGASCFVCGLVQDPEKWKWIYLVRRTIVPLGKDAAKHVLLGAGRSRLGRPVARHPRTRRRRMCPAPQHDRAGGVDVDAERSASARLAGFGGDSSKWRRAADVAEAGARTASASCRATTMRPTKQTGQIGQFARQSGQIVRGKVDTMSCSRRAVRDRSSSTSLTLRCWDLDREYGSGGYQLRRPSH